jgi:hypothetical protein
MPPTDWEAKLREACEAAAESLFGASSYDAVAGKRSSAARTIRKHIAPLLAEARKENSTARSECNAVDKWIEQQGMAWPGTGRGRIETLGLLLAEARRAGAEEMRKRAATVDPLGVACDLPGCDSAPGQMCWSKGEGPMFPHHTRWAAAIRALPTDEPEAGAKGEG